MHASRATFLTLSSAACVLASGCFFAPPRTSNQGGGTLLTAGVKITQGSLTELTPDEVQILADIVFDVSGNDSVPELNDDQAAAAVDFLTANDLNSVDDLRNLIAGVGDGSDVVIPQSVQDLLISGALDAFQDFDPDNLDIETIQRELTGGGG